MPYQPTKAALDGRAVFGSRIRDYRRAKGLTQEGLAHLAGLDRSFLVDLENGRHSCMVDRLHDIAGALEAQPWQLLRSEQT